MHPYASQAKSGNRSKVKMMTGKSVSGNIYDGESTRAAGQRTPSRLDNYARGGKVGKVTVNVITRGPPVPPPSGALPPLPPAPQPPPGLGGGAPPIPPGVGPGGPPPGMKTGGRLGMTAGAESGEGRLQKRKKYGLKPK